jgi:hypothetical protein
MPLQALQGENTPRLFTRLELEVAGELGLKLPGNNHSVSIRAGEGQLGQIHCV